MTEAQLRAILNEVSFAPAWGYRLLPTEKGWLFQLEFLSPFDEPWKRELQRGRKLYISPHMTESEVVQTYWLAVKLALEHEARERFHYKGKMLYGPHIAVEAHMQACAVREVREELKV